MWTVSEAANVLHYSEYQVRYLCHCGRLQAKRVKGKWEIYDLDYQNPRLNRRVVITTNYLRSLEPKNRGQRRAIKAVLNMILGPVRVSRSTTRFQIMEYLEAHGTCTAPQLAKAHNRDQHLYTVTLLRMTNEGYLTRVKKGVYTRC